MRSALVTGLIVGSLYGLYALGLVLVFKGSGVLNFAQAEVGTFTLFIAHYLIVRGNLPYVVGVVAMLVTAVAIGLAFERFAVRPLRTAPRVSVAVATIGLLSLLIAVEIVLYGPLPRLLDPPIKGAGVTIMGVLVNPTQVVSLFIVAGAGLSLAGFLRYTDFGLAVLASAQDQEAVRFSGIRLGRVSAFTWGLAAGLSGLAALLILPSVGSISIGAFGAIFVRALAAALVGGISSMPGAFVGGVVVGVFEAEVKHFTINTGLPGLADVVIFVTILAVLLFRPQGLLGEK